MFSCNGFFGWEATALVPCCSGDAFLLFLLVATIGEKGRTACQLPKKLRILQGGHATSFPASGHKENIQCLLMLNYTSKHVVHTKKTQCKSKPRIDDPQQPMFFFKHEKSASRTWGHNSWQAMGNNWQRSYLFPRRGCGRVTVLWPPWHHRLHKINRAKSTNI